VTNLSMALHPDASTTRRSTPIRRRRTAALRRLGSVATIAALLLTAVGVTTSAHATTSPGYVFVNPQLRGEAPHGYNVYISRAAIHHTAIGVYSSTAMRDLRGFGLSLRYMGYGHPAKTQGVITVSESAAGCAGGPTVLATTIWWYASLPKGGVYMYRADIIICPARFAHMPIWQRAAVLRHEFGHAMGLGHMNGVYAGTYQPMNSTTHSNVRSYRAGDAAGLRRLAAGTAAVRAQLG
jgi:hypothetical protein